MSDPMEQSEVILGVDTHLEVHVAVLIDVVGRVIATTTIPTTASGYEQLINWTSSFGRLTRAGVEGTGTYGAALARRMQEYGVQVIEINRPDRSRRRLRGKSDPTDAENAARAVLAGEANAIPKAQSGVVEAMRAVSIARRSAVKAKTQAINQLRALLVTAPESIRATLWKVKPEQCVARCARLQSLGDTPLLQALTNTLRLLARRWMSLANAAKLRWQRCAAQARWKRPRERPPGIALTGEAIEPLIMPCGRSRWFVCGAILGRVRTLLAELLRDCPRKRFNVALSVTSFA